MMHPSQDAPDTGSPLHRHCLFRSNDMDVARHMIAQQFCEHDLTGQAGVRDCAVVQNTVDFGSAALNYLDYGAGVNVGAAKLDGFVLLVMPLVGHVKFSSRGRQTICNSGQYMILPSDDRFDLNWSRDCRALILKGDETALRAKLATYTGRPAKGAFRLSPSIDAGSSAGRYLKTSVDAIVSFYDLEERANVPSLFVSSVRDQLLGFIVSQHLTLETGLPEAAALPRVVNKVMDYIRAHPEKHLNLDRLATVAGVSGRTLQNAFQRYRSMTPMDDVRSVRLARAREDLMTSSPLGPASVTDIAMKWGFFHCGRFSAYYKDQFGELPSETSRRTRGD